MPSINPEILNSLIEKFGPNIDLRTQSNVLNEILNTVSSSWLERDSSAIARGYMRSYFRGYDRATDPPGYERVYQQYDKTVEGIAFNALENLRPDLIEKFDPAILKRYYEILQLLK